MPFKKRKKFTEERIVGQRVRKRRGGITEYGRQVREKQLLKALYHIRERQFKRYVTETLAARRKSADIIELFVRKLETRLDNAVYRLGFAKTRLQARQLVTHGHFLVNGRRVDVPSYTLAVGDRIAVRPNSLEKAVFKEKAENLKKAQPPKWLELDLSKLEARVAGQPSLDEAKPPVEIPLVFEFYSR